MDTNRIGNICEIAIMQKFISIGANISIPFGDLPYDLIVEYNDKLLKIQIKSMWNCKDGVLRLSTTQGNKSNGSLRSYKETVDYIAGYNKETEHCVLIPIKDVTEPKMRFRYKTTKNNQKENLSIDIKKFSFENTIKEI